MKSKSLKHKASVLPLLASGAASALVLLGAALAYGQNGNVAFVRWTEPKEKSFSIQVPKGWKISGGLKRAGTTDIRQNVMAQSPGGDIMISIGDPTLPTFATLRDWERSTGTKEGSAINLDGSFTLLYYHYMPALEFNRMYLRKGVATALNDFKIVSEVDRAEEARNIEARANGVNVSMGSTEFSGTDKKTGKKISGILLSLTTLMPGSVPNYSQMWNARPVMVACLDDANKLARAKTAFNALAQMEKTWKPNAIWNKQEADREAQVTDEAKQKAADYVKKTGDNAKKFFYEDQARKAQQQQQFLGYIRNSGSGAGQ